VPSYLEPVYEYVPVMLGLVPNKASVMIFRCPHTYLGYLAPPTPEWCPSCDQSIDYGSSGDPHGICYAGFDGDRDLNFSWQDIQFARWVQGIDQFICLPRAAG
jgi:hypothetical protein